MTLRFGRRFVSAPAFLFVMSILAMLMPGEPRISRAAQEAPVQGDVTCDSSVNAVDSLQILRDVAGLGTTAGCLAGAGDVNCDAAVNSVDALRILRYVAGLPVIAPDGCAPIGDPLGLPPTSEALIAQALAGGDITPEESLLYRAYALYDHPDLPDEFRSPVPDMHAGLELFREVAQKESQLSQGLLDQLAPFSARPADPISIFNNPPNRVSAVPPVAWKSLPAAGGAARVWAQDDPGVNLHLTTYAAAVTKVWDALPGIFRYGIPDVPGPASINPDPAIDIYFVDPGSIDPRIRGCDAAVPTPPECVLADNGLTRHAAPNEGDTWSAYVLISTHRQGDALINTIAHELGHVGQFAYDAYEPMWLMDSTATWTAFRVVQKVNSTQTYTYERLPAFFKGLQKPLTRDTEDDLNRYGSWLFFFFASMEKGDEIVTKVWERAAANGKQNERAVDQAFPFDSYFDDFTVRNWNKKPPLTTVYKDEEETFPDHVPIPEPTITFGGPEESPIEESLEPLSARYYPYKFLEPVHSVIFRNKLNGKPHAHLWGIAKVNGEWQEPEDWTDIEKRTWCRDLPSQHLEELVVVFSNSGMTGTVTSSASSVEAKSSSACTDWEGTITQKYTWSSGGDTVEVNTSALVRFEPDSGPIPSGVPHDANATVVAYKAVSGTVYWTLEATSGFQNCSGTRSGSYSVLDSNYELGLRTLYVWDDGQPGLRYYGQGIKNEPTPASTPCGSKVEAAKFWFQAGEPQMVQRASTDGGTIEGTYGTSDMNVSQSWTWDLRRVPPGP